MAFGLNLGTLANLAGSFLTGGPLGAGVAALGGIFGGGGFGGGGGGGGNKPSGKPVDLYNEALASMLQGGGLPLNPQNQSQLQATMLGATNTANQQAQTAERRLAEQMASRGVVNSSVYANAIANMRGGIANELANLRASTMGQLTQQQLSTLAQAAGLYQQQQQLNQNQSAQNASNTQNWLKLAMGFMPKTPTQPQSSTVVSYYAPNPLSGGSSAGGVTNPGYELPPTTWNT